MKPMRIKNRIAVLALVSVLCACSKDDLSLKPISSIGDNAFYQDEDQVKGAVIAIYDGLQEIPKTEFALTEMRSDNTRSRIGQGDIGEFEIYRILPTNFYVGQNWKDNYNVIFRANRVLGALDVVENGDLKAQFEGEAKFARALAHFNLANAFGDVPILDKEVGLTDEVFSDYLVRDAVTEVMSFVVGDLQDAMELLPERGAIEEGRATKGAAMALLAKVYLTQGNYASAQTLTSQLLADSNYALVEEYGDVFYSELNSEIIFAILYIDDDSSEGQNFAFEFTLACGTCYNFLEDNFASAVEPEDTERAAVLFNDSDDETIGKYLPTSSNIRLAGNDWIVLRLADVYLMHAEAIMSGGDSTNDIEAIGAYNAIRARVGLSTLPEDGTGTLTKEALLHERRIELAFENHRFYDLVRFGVAQDVLTAHATSENNSFSETDLLNPIPQAEINVSGGLLEQNPGY